MNTPYVPEDARRSVARELSRFYGELAGNEPAETRRFSLGRAINCMATERGLHEGYEHEICASAALLAGRRHDPHRTIFPWSAFSRRDLTVASAASAGYLVGQDKRRPVDKMRSWSTAGRAGITVLDGLVGNPSIPQVITAALGSWLPTEATPITQSEPTIGETTATPKAASGYLRFSRQLSMQAESFDAFIEQQLLEAVGALIDQAVISGSGASGQPLGITNTTTGIGTVSGTAFSHASTKTMRRQILDAGGLEERIAWVGATDVQDLLGGRQRFSGSDRTIWDDGNILARPATATKHVPAGVLIAGDWSRAILCLWGPGFTVELDPYSFFTSAKLAARCIVHCDVVLAPAAAFSVATAVT